MTSEGQYEIRLGALSTFVSASVHIFLLSDLVPSGNVAVIFIGKKMLHGHRKFSPLVLSNLVQVLINNTSLTATVSC